VTGSEDGELIENDASTAAIAVDGQLRLPENVGVSPGNCVLAVGDPYSDGALGI
jgi:hypothetical protein